MSQLTPHNDEVLFAATPLVTVDRQLIAGLVRRAEANARKRMRVCAHQQVEDPLHEMLVVHTQATYVRPHRHAGAESFHVIEGRADVVLLDEGGGVTDVIPMGDYASGQTFYYRLSAPHYHTLLIRSAVLVFHEAKEGPFRPAENVAAPWAPELYDVAGQQAYLRRLEQAVGAFRHAGAVGGTALT